ncbi:hypothetical protein IWX47DRAFT_905350 [Phyllosticta citricarpa]
MGMFEASISPLVMTMTSIIIVAALVLRQLMWWANRRREGSSSGGDVATGDGFMDLMDRENRGFRYAL